MHRLILIGCTLCFFGAASPSQASALLLRFPRLNDPVPVESFYDGGSTSFGLARGMNYGVTLSSDAPVLRSLLQDSSSSSDRTKSVVSVLATVLPSSNFTPDQRCSTSYSCNWSQENLSFRGNTRSMKFSDSSQLGISDQAPGSISSVPEPSSLLLVVTGVIALCGKCRRRSPQF